MSQLALFVAFGVCCLRFARACGPSPLNGGSCYVGYLRPGDPPSVSQTAVCGGLKNNWCMISHDTATGETYFNCYDYWQSSGQCSAIPRPCGDDMQDTNHGGCSQIFPYGRPLLMCCCKGNHCNNPALFDAALRLNNVAVTSHHSYYFSIFNLIVVIYCAILR
uniref:Uncharacterized protein n=1 Tax=Plectus sambesii TaxID=2011161 RepID=A0A914VPL6_9BILA